MAGNTIEHLPDEVLYEIFEYFDGSTLKTCTVVCSRWDELIGSSPKTMKNFKFVLKGIDWFYKISEINKLRRKFHSIELNLLPAEVVGDAVMVAKRHNAHLRELIINGNCLDLDLSNLLKDFKLLETLSIDSFHSTTSKQISLPHLKNLKFTFSNFQILESIIDTRHLLSIELSSNSASADFDRINQFLKRNPSLKSLKMSSFSITYFLRDEIPALPFEMKKLELIYPNMLTELGQEYFMSSMKAHETSIRYLTLNLWLSVTLYQYVLMRFENLVQLQINVELLPTEKSFWYCITPLQNIRELKLFGKFTKHEIARHFMSCFPNVLSLDMTSMNLSKWFMNFLRHVSSCQPLIESFLIPNIFDGMPQNLEFKNLRSFTVNTMYDVPQWKRFVLNHRFTIEEIIVKNFTIQKRSAEKFSANSKQLFGNIIDMPNLRRMSFSSDKIDFLKMVFDAFKDDCKNLKCVHFRTSVKKANKNCDYTIWIPADKRFWNPFRYEYIFCNNSSK